MSTPRPDPVMGKAIRQIALLRGQVGPPICVLCGQQVDRWTRHPDAHLRSPFMQLIGAVGSDLEHYLCPKCHCNDRDRHLWLYMDKAGLLLRIQGSRILHIAPETHVMHRLRQLTPMEYICGDLHPVSHEYLKINCEHLEFTDDCFDLAICNHVLEHVSRPDRAIAELARCLKPRGLLIAQTPYAPLLMKTFELSTGISPPFAQLFYGQEDHVRLFGADIVDYFRNAGLTGGLFPHDLVLPGMDAGRYGCNAREPFFLFSKDPSATFHF